jgi:drug/metabolite transporter (DMT)-like permease
MVPIWVAVFEWVRHRTKLRPLTVAGLGAGFAGAALLAVARGGTALDLLAALYALCAGAIWASGSVYARRAVVPESPIVFTGMELLTGGIALTIVGSLAGEWRSFHLDMVTASSAGGWLYLLVVGSIIGFTSYTWLLRNVRPQIATTYAYVNPLIAVLLGVAFNHERLTLATVVAGAVIVGAVATIVLSAGRDAAASPRAAPEASAELLV